MLSRIIEREVGNYEQNSKILHSRAERRVERV